MKTSPTPVVSDADVLIHLAKLGKLTLLRALYGYMKESRFPNMCDKRLRPRMITG
jgi:hypothetical protein